MGKIVSKWAGKLRRFIASKDRSSYVEKFFRIPRRWQAPVLSYQDRYAAERSHFDEVLDVNALPPIFHYWSDTYLRPMVEAFGVSRVDDWFAVPFAESAAHDRNGRSVFASIGAGNCDIEVSIAKRMKALGVDDFAIECLDMNGTMLARGKALAAAEGVEDRLVFVETDLNHWHANRLYSGIMANQSLHHIVNLEGMFAEVKLALRAGAPFVVGDTIGRNGHMRWPEALEPLQEFWKELPHEYRYNQILRRQEDEYVNWDCSGVGFEGVRAQDILALLVERFHFQKFIAFGNVTDVFIDRAFGHHFDPASDADRRFIDRVHAFDERGFADGSLKPTHMFAVLASTPSPQPHYSRGLSPAYCIRDTTALRLPGAYELRAAVA